MGKKTRTAIRAFQRDHKLRVDGEASKALVEALEQAKRSRDQEQERQTAQAELTTMSPSELYVRAVQFEAQGDIENALKYYEYLMETYPDHELAVKAADRVTALSTSTPQLTPTPTPQPTPTPIPQLTEEEIPTPQPTPTPKPRKKRDSSQGFSVANRFGVGILSNSLNFGLGPSVEYWATENLGIMGSVGALADFFSLSIRGNFLFKRPFYIAEQPLKPYVGVGYVKVQGPEVSYGIEKVEVDGSGVEIFGGLLHQATWLHDKIFFRSEFCYSTVELEATFGGTSSSYGGVTITVPEEKISVDYSAFTINLGIAYLF